jgi:hypothetical protein
LQEQRLREHVLVTRGTPLQLATVMLVGGFVACGRTPLDEAPAEPPGDASTLDAPRDANRGHVEAAVDDSFAAADEGTPADSALDGSPSLDDAERPDATVDATADASADTSTNDAADASEGGQRQVSCDLCTRGEQQCGNLPQVCTYDDGGAFHCEPGQKTIWTCVVGDAGCAVWEKGLTCSPDIPCCASCMYIYICPIGGPEDPCQQDTDCAFNACDAILHECIFNQCTDRHQDGQETDVDCGGPLCDPCTVNRRCQSNLDCYSGHLCGASHLCE